MSEENGNGTQEVTAEVGPGGVKVGAKVKRMSEIIAVLSLCGLGFVGYMVHLHGQAAEKTDTAIAVAIKELAKSQQESVTAQREMTCIISLPQDKREAEFASPFGLCKRISR